MQFLLLLLLLFATDFGRFRRVSADFNLLDLCWMSLSALLIVAWSTKLSMASLESSKVSLFLFFYEMDIYIYIYMECFPFSDLRIFSLSIPLCEWLTSTPFLLLVYYLFLCWIFAVALVWCLGIKFHK